MITDDRSAHFTEFTCCRKGEEMTCRFREKGVTFGIQGNIGFTTRERPALEGRLSQ